jgi:hypothetical protein
MPDDLVDDDAKVLEFVTTVDDAVVIVVAMVGANVDAVEAPVDEVTELPGTVV